ncbi:uncharacterized protein TNIN_360291 [Trichonephila inaurata madagascariensis]|uniref:Uncharacterized protein n=1 Tax=Trichonephila inaurata madagascariensis TaxID=2747483 RepID=A0A8X6JCE6_9ARAC|nr:uncharacterized protein TNIN_360291 [Trichonephila inaurata madagascariensis]
MKLKSVVSLRNPTPVRDGNLQERVTFTFRPPLIVKATQLNPPPLRSQSHSMEALEVFHNLPSDIESDESSLSEAEDVMTAKSSSSENTDIDEEKDDISVPGPSRIFEVGEIKRL